jgi:uncharacterized protein
MTIHRLKDYKRMPWKNGGGETLEIAVFPADASVGDFDWRISMATVATDGPFSCFPKIDRTIAIIDGDAIELSVEGRPPVLLDQAAEPYSFPGDAPTSGRLRHGPIADLNVMVRRGSLHSVRRMDARALSQTATDATTLFIVALQEVTIRLGDEEIALGRHDTLDLSGSTMSDVAGEGPGTVLLIAIG